MSSIRNDKNKYGYILESGQLHPKIVNEVINFDNTVVICLGLGDLLLEDIVTLCLEHDTRDDWTYGLSKEYLRKHAEDWFRSNKILKEECKDYGRNI